MRAALLLAAAAADFVFVDFNETQGLRLNGAAATSACEEVEARSHGPHETNLGEGSLDEVYGENDDVMKTVTVDTNPLSSFQDDALAKKAILGHRDRYAAGDRSCAGRVRLTPSRPDARGSVWYHLPRPVQGGFESSFTFNELFGVVVRPRGAALRGAFFCVSHHHRLCCILFAARSMALPAALLP